MTAHYAVVFFGFGGLAHGALIIPKVLCVIFFTLVIVALFAGRHPK
jgi:uncharacterized membrane protein YtjA (UPF0391 family)